MTLGRARPTPTTTREECSCLINVAQAPFCCLRLPGGQRGLLRREDGYDGRPPRSVNVVGDCASDLDAPEAILPLAAARVRVFFWGDFLSARSRERGCWCLPNSANLMAHSRTAMRRAL